MSYKPTERKSFASIKEPLPFPDFLDVQLESFNDFLQLNRSPDQRKNEGLYKAFKENFPVTDGKEEYKLEFINYYIDLPSLSEEECLSRGLTYSVPLKAVLHLSYSGERPEDNKSVTGEVFMGKIPYMTKSGSFIINGAERVVVSQLHRSPGVFFNVNQHDNGSLLYSARIIPFKGSWMEFAIDVNNAMYVYIDRKKKIAVTTLLRAIGYDEEKILTDLFPVATSVTVSEEALKPYYGRKLAAPVTYRFLSQNSDSATGETIDNERVILLLDPGTEISDSVVNLLLEKKIEKVFVVDSEKSGDMDYSVIINTLAKARSNSYKEALEEIYREMRNQEASDITAMEDLVKNLFFSTARCDLGEVGRYRMNNKLKLDVPMDVRTVTKEDIVEIIRYLVGIQSNPLTSDKKQIYMTDDIDHLSNRRVRTIGEQLYNQFGLGLSRMARVIKERLNTNDGQDTKFTELVNTKILTSVINTFFGSNALSQFMDQTNPLAEITHKRRLSALGPGGLSRDRAGFEVRDVHYTHYGRLCPIETPEGPNIGLISSLCVYAKINKMGFISTPYREASNGRVDFQSEVKYYTAEEEEDKTVAQGNALLDDEGNFKNPLIKSRLGSDFPHAPKNEVHLMDVSPMQIASIAASLIPFLEHDDANRALMGSNMMRQAVPLINPEAPIVGTGIEQTLVSDSRTQVVAEGDGTIEYVDATMIKVRYDRSEEDEFVSFEDSLVTYHLPKFRKTNQSTTIDLRPICRKGERVKAGDILTDGFSTRNGELALGRNVQVAYMPWKGYNYEDAIVLNERLVQDDVFTSVHVDEYLLEVRETKRGAEVLTSDIPNVSEDATKDLDERGIVRVGAHIHPGDILIGKITPKGESDPSAEEKLLQAIFGDKAADQKDASLKANPSLKGVVIKTYLFSKNKLDRKELTERKKEIKAKCEAEKDKLRGQLLQKLEIITKDCMANEIVSNDLHYIEAGTRITPSALLLIDFDNVDTYSAWTTDADANRKIDKLMKNYERKRKEIDRDFHRREQDIVSGDELPNGVLQIAKVLVAKKRKIQVGDKMCGRHGNKGIVSKIVRQEDMPFLADGTPMDLCLNPLGVPSRMNIGQIFEAILGWAGKKLNMKFATPIFDGATLDDKNKPIENDINYWAEKAGLQKYGVTKLIDGGTGEEFDQPATVGVTYFLKLGHMVDDKMHARSIGPYSLVTQQPLGGKAQFGGQRFGEMEVWALEAYGAAHLLREMLTIKSDDIVGRSHAYEAIVKGAPMPTPGIPESLNVLLYELKGLGLSFTME